MDLFCIVGCVPVSCVDVCVFVCGEVLRMVIASIIDMGLKAGHSLPPHSAHCLRSPRGWDFHPFDFQKTEKQSAMGNLGTLTQSISRKSTKSAP